MAEDVHPRPRFAGRAPARRAEPGSLAAPQPGFRLGRVAGVEVRVDWSLAIIFWLIVVNLGAGLFPARHPTWSPALSWSVAVVAAVLFFLSILAHEMAHALVGRARGVPVDGITLFLFGGVARLGGEPKSAGSEFLIAVVGPLTSFVIAALSIAGAAALGHAGLAHAPALSALGPAATVLLWLGTTNVMLGAFNLLPGFPLDGGRVLRAVLWKITGDVGRATRGATAVGQVIAGLLIFAGVTMAFGTRVPFLGSGLAQGLWLVLIGWFLNNAARATRQQQAVSEIVSGALGDVPVANLMRTRGTAVDAELPIGALVERFFMPGDQRCFPVLNQGDFAGLVCLADLRKIPRESWSTTPVRDIMTPADALAATRPDERAADALGRLASRDVDQLPVIDQGQLVGMIRRADLLRWIELHAPRGDHQNHPEHRDR
jgi:Zn-dependent protease/CBS domain-containing protein